MKKPLLLILSTTLSLNIWAQEPKLTLIPCNTYNAMEEGFKADPNLKLKYELIQSQMDAEYKAYSKTSASAQRTTATQSVIPVVFHIMGQQAVTDQTFINLISYINNDYGKLGNDVTTINSNFASLYIDSDIRFALAKKDPLGNCTNGIIRHNTESIYWNQNTPAYNYSGTGGTGRWPTNQYLNVYIVECIASSTNTCPVTSGSYIGGYTYLPGGTPYTSNGNKGDAIVVLRNQLAQSDPHDSRTLSHEIGHWLNLSHTFGSTNNPGVACGDDGLSDTPNTKGYFSTCPGNNAGPYTSCDPIENIENIMDYSSCPKMFTQMQINRMRSALASTLGGRNNLSIASNQVATGLAAGSTCTPLADFVGNKTIVCANNPINFTDMSQIGGSGSVSWNFDGGSPATSTSTAPIVTYATPGTYSVSITATNVTGNNTKSIVYVTVVQGGAGSILPYTHDLESGNLLGLNVTNYNTGSVAWDINTATGANSTAKSIFLNNASQSSSSNQLDVFETMIYNFTTTTNISMSWYYAYAKKTTTQVDSFKVQYTTDCGGTWSNVLSVPSLNTMATNTGGTTSTAFVPTAVQWKQTVINPALLNALNNKPSVKFRFYFRGQAAGGGSNNIYIDQINLSGTVGMNDLENNLGLIIYPNPTNSCATLNFNGNNNEKVKVSVVDIFGRVIEESGSITLDDTIGTYIINKNGNIEKGIYMINIEANNQRVTKKLIVE